jgi:putative two-component system response regulator
MMLPAAKSRVLVADDDDRVRRILEVRLAAMGHDVILAVNGEDALEKALRDSPDLVLLDVMMPKLDGFATARRLKASPETSHIPIVMVTALTDVQDRVRALEAGADDFLSKPVDPSELKARVQSLLKVKAHNDHMRHCQHDLEIEVAKRTEALQEALHKVQATTLDTIHRLSRAAEYRDEDSGDHLQRVSHYAAAVARQLGQPESFTQMLLYAVPMHDVGKIGIPDRILLKPDRLDAEEAHVMRMHVEIGASILSGSDADVLQMAESIALTHHEKWNGTGYPHGLREEAIPLVGRIVAIADVFDALGSQRPYKAAFPHEESMAIIRSERGQHFDPVAVDAFLAVEAEILDAKTRFQGARETRLIGRVGVPVGYVA